MARTLRKTARGRSMVPFAMNALREELWRLMLPAEDAPLASKDSRSNNAATAASL